MKKFKNKSEEDNLKNYDKWAFVILIGGIILTFLSPWLFTRPWGWLELTKTGAIGDSIGGITAPIIGLTSAGLIYLSFRAQIKMNLRQWQEIKKTEIHESNLRNEQYAMKLAEILKGNANDINNNVNSILMRSYVEYPDSIVPFLGNLSKLISPISKIMDLFQKKNIDKQTLFLVDMVNGIWINNLVVQIDKVIVDVEKYFARDPNIEFKTKETSNNDISPTNEELLHIYLIELKEIRNALKILNLNVSL